MNAVKHAAAAGLAIALACLASAAQAQSKETVGVAMYFADAAGDVKPVLVTHTIYDGSSTTMSECQEGLETMTTVLRMQMDAQRGTFVKSECVDVETFKLEAK